MRRSLRKLLVVVLVLVVLGILLYRSRAAIMLEDFSWAQLSRSVREARFALLWACVAGIYLTYAIRALRWVRFSRYLKRSTFVNVYSATLMGFAAIFLLGRAGEPLRPLLIARKDRVPVSSSFGIYVLERVFDTASTAALAGLSLLIFPADLVFAGASSVWVGRFRTTGLLLLVGILAAIAFLAYFRVHGASALERRLAGWRDAVGWRRRFAGLFAGFSDGLQAIRTLPDLAAAVGYSVVHWTLIVVIYLLVARSFGGRLAEIGFPGAMLVLASSMVGSTLLLPGVGGGAQVATFLAFTVVFGVEKEPAAAASIVLWLVTFAASALVGVPLVLREGWSMGELRRLARAEAEAEAAGEHVTVADPAGFHAGKPANPGDSLR